MNPFIARTNYTGPYCGWSVHDPIPGPTLTAALPPSRAGRCRASRPADGRTLSPLARGRRGHGRAGPLPGGSNGRCRATDRTGVPRGSSGSRGMGRAPLSLRTASCRSGDQCVRAGGTRRVCGRAASCVTADAPARCCTRARLRLRTWRGPLRRRDRVRGRDGRYGIRVRRVPTCARRLALLDPRDGARFPPATGGRAAAATGAAATGGPARPAGPGDAGGPLVRCRPAFLGRPDRAVEESAAAPARTRSGPQESHPARMSRFSTMSSGLAFSARVDGISTNISHACGRPAATP